jgi:hypothetical protein
LDAFKGIFKCLRELASSISDIGERINFLAWLDGTESVNRIIGIAERGRELDHVVRLSPACDKAWVAELRAMKDKKRYRADVLIPIVNRLIPVVVADPDITPAIRADVMARMQKIQSDLRHLSTAN